MGIVFAVRGNSTTARYSGGENTALEIPSAHTITSDAGALSGSYINMTTAGNRACIWHALKNLPNGRPISILLRMRPSYSGAPSGIRGLFSIDSGIGASGPRMTFFHNVTDGAVKVIGTKTDNNATFNNVSFGNWTTNVSGTYYDLVFTWDGTTTASAAKFYIDGTSLGTLTASNASDSAMDNLYYKAISLGSNTAVALAAMGVDEFVIWDSVIDPTSVALVSGTGSLNGASRTSLVNVASFDGSTYTDPGVANVKTGTSYTFNGTSNTGTYDGSDRWTDPGESYVANGVQYKANSTTNNKTGTYVPTVSAATIADAVWDEATSGHTTSGTFGALIQKLLTVAKFLGLK